MELIALRSDRGVHCDEYWGVYLWENQAMSDESELKRLRADLEVLERYNGCGYNIFINDAVKETKEKIAEAEAAADPWRVAKQFAADHRKNVGRLGDAADYIYHLTAENARLTARVAELEDVKPIADMQPPFEGPIVGLEPVLDPARVLATAAEVMQLRGYRGLSANLFGHAKDAKPYPLKKGGE